VFLRRSIFFSNGKIHCIVNADLMEFYVCEGLHDLLQDYIRTVKPEGRLSLIKLVKLFRIIEKAENNNLFAIFFFFTLFVLFVILFYIFLNNVTVHIHYFSFDEN
jgi:hypothetical protein